MDIERRIREARNLTPTEQQIATAVTAMGERLQGYSIKEFARAANVSVPSIHRFCKKLGLEGFKELKVEFARSLALRRRRAADVDINFPFATGDTADDVLERMASVYEATLRDTRSLLDAAAVDRAAALVDGASVVDIYTQSHNLYPAFMFRDRLLSAGKAATCFEGAEQLMRTALASDESHVAIAISYSGLAQYLSPALGILREQGTPVVLIGTPSAERLNPGLTVYLNITDRESLQNRITQFASHIAVQYVLDTLYGCFFARDYERSRSFLARSLPYTSLPALRREGAESHDEYVARMMSELR